MGGVTEVDTALFYTQVRANVKRIPQDETGMWRNGASRFGGRGRALAIGPHGPHFGTGGTRFRYEECAHGAGILDCFFDAGPGRVRCMNPVRLAWFAVAALAGVIFSLPLQAQPAREVPGPLKGWESWATWGDKNVNSPVRYSDPDAAVPFWPGRLRIDAGNEGAVFTLDVRVFDESWVPLPGGGDLWPADVMVSGKPAAVLDRDGRPSVKLPAGTHTVTGRFPWRVMPQRVRLPGEIGIVELAVGGENVALPFWDAQGFLWLNREASPDEETARDFLSVKVYGLLEDGIPMWMRVRVELIVSGKSREEDIGNVLPEGWSLSGVESPIPVAVEDSGLMKAQVRAGRWTVNLSAFRLTPAPEIRFAPGARTPASEILLGFAPAPGLRLVEIAGAPAVDVSQTTFPDDWRNFAVYRWECAEPLRMVERMRGMGLQQPEPLRITRQFWLDEDGRAFTFRDSLTGNGQQIWRLDAANGQELGSVRSGDQGQLITANPATGAPGVEIRTRDLFLEATGRMPAARSLPATGWQTDAEGIQVTLNLPPGWRLFALFGSDWVKGDWLTSWTLLDLFVVLIFTLAMFRVWGFGAAVLGFAAMVLAYHEPGAPRYVWLALLVPVVLLALVPSGWPAMLMRVWKWATVAALVLVLAPFVSKQVQQALYPQLEIVPESPAPLPAAARQMAGEALDSVASNALPSAPAPYFFEKRAMAKEKEADKSNLLQDAGARIQTGPGVPDWTWRTVTFGWNGPVRANQEFRPLLIPAALGRALTVLRIVLLIALGWVMLAARRFPPKVGRPAPTGMAALLAVLLLAPAGASAQFPDADLLETLRTRLLEKPDAFAGAAEIPSAQLRIDGDRLTLSARVDAAYEVAVPLPGRFPAWSPVSVKVDGVSAAALRRDDGFLWVVVPGGVHTVEVAGRLGGATEWEWGFSLRPRRLAIEAPGWSVSGLRPDGVPEQQILFSKLEKTDPARAAYDRQDFLAVAAVERRIEFGLVWQVNTTVRRLSAPGKAIVLRIPLLPGENVLSSNVIVRDGELEARIGANADSFSWQSELGIEPSLVLTARAGDQWAERWRLAVSPVWNVAITGLAPVFEPGNPELVPTWNPWPGEQVTLAISRPQAVPGATITANSVARTIALGDRQRTEQLTISLTTSLGEDYPVELPPDAAVTSLKLDGRDLPVRVDAGKVIVPLNPGRQNLEIGWKCDRPLGFEARADAVRLPTESANVRTTMTVPAGRWVLWADGPQRGPAVRFWTVLACSLIAAAILARLRHSPLGTVEWMLLALGLTQVPLVIALMVVGWLFLLAWRGRPSFQKLSPPAYNSMQVILIGATFAALCIFLAVVGEGLLGSPEMFIAGNGSTSGSLQWYLARGGLELPRPACFSVSVWWYRLLMLAWALWLASAVIRWLRWGWGQFCAGGCFRRKHSKPAAPPPIPPARG